MKYHYTAVVTAAFALLSSQAVSAFAAPATSLRSTLKPAFSTSTSSASRSGATNGGTNTGLSMVLGLPRGGATIVSTLSSKVATATSTPTGLFNSALLTLGLTTAAIKILQRSTSDNSVKKAEKPASVKSLQLRYLAVFWLIRCADWLQGPYFYEVYASKVFGGVQASMGLVSKLFLTGFASTALFGPLVGRASDTYGRKKGTLAFVLLYSLGAVSTKSPLLTVLLLGRVLSGIGTSLLFSAPESWLVGESQKGGDDPDGNYLGETFGMAYAGDAIVAIIAGQFAGAAAGARGPTGPFELSTVFLAMGGILATLLWKENKATSSATPATSDDDKDDDGSSSKGASIREAIDVVRAEPKIMMVGAVQSLFEAAMYIFVLQWPPAISSAIATKFGTGVGTPYGTVFSCFMACCLLGSTLFGQFAKMGVRTEAFTAGMLALATLAMGASTVAASAASPPLWALVAGFFLFEGCVGMYFPSIGTLRSKYVPDSHRSVIMNLFGIPLNALVVGVFLSIKRLGLTGALGISTGALGVATMCMFALKNATREKVSVATA